MSGPPRVFVSYSHDSDTHKARVRGLADRLRAEGVDAWIDQYEVAPPEGWPRWMQRQVEEADFVVLVCTETWARRFEGREQAGKGKGATWEGLLAQQVLYDAGTINHRLVPVRFEHTPGAVIPLVLRAYTAYCLDAEYESLYRHLTGQPANVAPEVGALRVLPPVPPAPSHVAAPPRATAPSGGGPTVVFSGTFTNSAIAVGDGAVQTVTGRSAIPRTSRDRGPEPTPQPTSGPAPVEATMRLLHLSDLHFDGKETWDRRAALEGLLRLVGEERLAPHLVLVTGDVANTGKQEEYEQAEEFLGRLMDKLGLEARQLFVVPGNHDVDQDRIAPGDRRIVNGLVAEALGDDFDPNGIEEILCDAGQAQLLSGRLDAFYAFTHRLLGPRAWDPRRPWRVDTVEVEGRGVGIVGLNTAWASGPQDAQGRLLLGEAQVREALAELSDVSLRIAMMHHPLAWLADARSAGGVLRAPGGADLVLTGHLHDAEAVARTGPDGTVLEFGAGATWVGGRWPLGFSLVELGAERGTIHFYGWSPKGRGFWRPDNGRYEGAKEGRWTFPLPCRVRPPEVEPGDRLAAQVTRYRSVMAAYHAQVSFIGLSTRGNAPQKNDVGDLFVPLVAGRRGQDAGGLDPAALAGLLASRHRDGRAVRVVLLGDPGSGKTTLTRALAAWAAGALPLGDQPAATNLVPLRVPFREYVADLGRYEGDGIIDFLVRQAAALDVPRDRAFFEALLAEGRALVLLDGLDEVARPDQRDQTVRRVRVFADTWDGSPVLVTSRVVGYADVPLPGEAPRIEARDDGPWPFEHLVMRPLSDEAIALLVARWYAAKEPDRRLRQELVSDLQGALAASPRVRELARNPLLATLVCVVHGHRARLPGERVKLYEEVVTTLLETWGAAKKGAESGFEELDPGRQRRYLEGLALEMMRERVAAANQERPAPARSPRRGDDDSGVVIARDRLVATLTRLATEPGTDARALGRTMARWVDWLAARRARPGSRAR